MLFNWLGIAVISLLLIIVVSINSIFVVRSVANIPKDFDDCISRPKSSIEDFSIDTPLAVTDKEEYLRKHINSLVQVCRYTMKTSDFSIPSFWISGSWIDHDRYSHWFTRNDVYSFLNPHFNLQI